MTRKEKLELVSKALSLSSTRQDDLKKAEAVVESLDKTGLTEWFLREIRRLN